MDSIFTDRLGTNYVPSDGEIDEIKHYLSAPEAQLRELEKGIARIQTILEDLMRKRDAILVTIEGHRALISPARRLPRDVVQEIFLKCLPEKHNAIMSGREAPLILGRICREWRDVALHTPQLWSSIHIPLILYGTTDDEVRLDILRYDAIKSWLNKSGACPLSISLPAVRGHADEPYTETSKLLLDYLLTHVKRWKKMEFNVPNKILEALSFVSPVDDLSCLEKLDFSLFYQHPDSNPSGFNLHNSNLLKAPNLRSLAVRLGHENIPSLPVSWANLTELDFEPGSMESYLSPSSVLMILRQTTKLVKLRFTLAQGLEIEDSDQILTLPTLESLAIVEDSGANGTKLYAKLDFPKLKQIHYMSGRYDEDDAFPLLELISSKKISLSLRSIHILDHAVTMETFRHLLLGAPALTRLSLQLSVAHNFPQHDILSFLTPATPSFKCLCPLLDTIIISGDFFGEESLFKLMIARNLGCVDGVRSLRRVSANFPHAPTKNRDNELALLRATGMDLSLDYYENNIDFRRNPRIGLRSYPWLDEHYYPST